MITLRQAIIPLTFALLLFACGGALLLGDFSEEAIRRTIRWTANCSFLLLCLAFSASAIHRRLPGGQWAGVMAARRRIGLAFALSHTVHLLTIVLLVEVVFAGN